MFAKNLEVLLWELCESADISHFTSEEFATRFDTLRGSGRLPRGRENRHKHLSSRQIAAAVLGIASSHEGQAGVGAIVLAQLRAVGGSPASFFGATTLEGVLEHILDNPVALESLVSVCVSLAEPGTNANGYASVLYEVGGARREAFYVPGTAVSLLQRGSEDRFDFERRNSPVSRELVFNREFFRRITDEVERTMVLPEALGDGAEYDAEEAKQERYRRLDVRPGSRFLNIGVDNQVTWPRQETLVKFDRYTLVLMPKTKNNVQSVHVDLTANRLTGEEAMTVINRFLSVMTWCSDQYAIAQDGWSGNPVPVAVPKRDLAFSTAYQWVFDRSIPSTEEARRALALYRDGRNAEQNFMVSYAVLNFYRIIEIKHEGKAAAKKWFKDNFEVVREKRTQGGASERFAEICGSKQPHEYLYEACRVAVSHAGKRAKSDPDESSELRRLHTAVDVLRILARHFISTELHVSDCMFSGE